MGSSKLIAVVLLPALAFVIALHAPVTSATNSTSSVTTSAPSSMSNPNVRVAVSLDGGTVNNSSVFFNVISVDSWVENVVSSVTSIVPQYGLDNIDIDYEQF
ncbi:hypothetical protein BDA96_01G262500 [Sorghum bicolor]|uniref:GH18 domain-containing protein n=1 Tax=Sorghum bicolor TaxID=4558 RepID=A0A921S044_SORBI|nr:hypothetical protein BDA96_01G262500 [Sorghum bicolor]